MIFPKAVAELDAKVRALDAGAVDYAPARWGRERCVVLGITPREAETVFWLSEGKTNAAIALLMDSSRRTVEKCQENLLRKPGVENRADDARVPRAQR